jgi:hypothetical protein
MARNFVVQAVSLAGAAFLMCGAAKASTIGDILVCYACQNSGNAAVDTALAANPSVAADGLLFAFQNTSGAAITGGVLSVGGTSPADSFTLPTIAAGSTFILMPGITTDGGSHPSGGLFAPTGITMDTSDGDGHVSDSSVFSFTGLFGLAAVTSNTPGSPAGTFSPGNPLLLLPYRDDPIGTSISFVGDGPSGDGGCSNCYFGQVATLDIPNVGATPLPATWVMMLTGFVGLGFMFYRRPKPGDHVSISAAV